MSWLLGEYYYLYYCYFDDAFSSLFGIELNYVFMYTHFRTLFFALHLSLFLFDALSLSLAAFPTKIIHHLSLFSISRFHNPLTLPLSTIINIGGLASTIAMPSMFHFFANVVSEQQQDHPSKLGVHVASLTWLVASAITAAFTIYRDSSLLRIFSSGGYTQLNGSSSNNNNNNADIEGDDKTLKPNTNVTPQPVYATPPPASPEAFNMFDPADLPPRLSEYANMVYSACEDLGNFFGFQDASVRNQAEHLLILLSNHRRYMNSHILPPALQPPSPIHALHAKVFSNYMKWCRYQGVPPHFSKMSSSTAGMAAPPSVASRVVDLVMFFCVWGEACNIRHMPECLWFLYHKMMEEYTMEQSQRSLYAGHFLDCVVTPIFKILSAVSIYMMMIMLLYFDVLNPF